MPWNERVQTAVEFARAKSVTLWRSNSHSWAFFCRWDIDDAVLEAARLDTEPRRWCQRYFDHVRHGG
jgi:hypothetical protein